VGIATSASQIQLQKCVQEVAGLPSGVQSVTQGGNIGKGGSLHLATMVIHDSPRLFNLRNPEKWLEDGSDTTRLQAIGQEATWYGRHYFQWWRMPNFPVATDASNLPIPNISPEEFSGLWIRQDAVSGRFYVNDVDKTKAAFQAGVRLGMTVVAASARPLAYWSRDLDVELGMWDGHFHIAATSSDPATSSDTRFQISTYFGTDAAYPWDGDSNVASPWDEYLVGNIPAAGTGSIIFADKEGSLQPWTIFSRTGWLCCRHFRNVANHGSRRYNDEMVKYVGYAGQKSWFKASR
jgi:hypothetical protein